MAIKPVSKMGNARLAQPSENIKRFGDKALYDLIQDMKDTMKVEEGIGIAAPQIGCNKRVIIFGYEKTENQPSDERIPFTVLINPTIEILDNKLIEGWEACLSVPGLCGL